MPIQPEVAPAMRQLEKLLLDLRIDGVPAPMETQSDQISPSQEPAQAIYQSTDKPTPDDVGSQYSEESFESFKPASPIIPQAALDDPRYLTAVRSAEPSDAIPPEGEDITSDSLANASHDGIVTQFKSQVAARLLESQAFNTAQLTLDELVKYHGIRQNHHVTPKGWTWAPPNHHALGLRSLFDDHTMEIQLESAQPGPDQKMWLASFDAAIFAHSARVSTKPSELLSVPYNISGNKKSFKDFANSYSNRRQAAWWKISDAFLVEAPPRFRLDLEFAKVALLFFSGNEVPEDLRYVPLRRYAPYSVEWLQGDRSKVLEQAPFDDTLMIFLVDLVISRELEEAYESRACIHGMRVHRHSTYCAVKDNLRDLDRGKDKRHQSPEGGETPANDGKASEDGETPAIDGKTPEDGEAPATEGADIRPLVASSRQASVERGDCHNLPQGINQAESNVEVLKTQGTRQSLEADELDSTTSRTKSKLKPSKKQRRKAKEAREATNESKATLEAEASIVTPSQKPEELVGDHPPRPQHMIIQTEDTYASQNPEQQKVHAGEWVEVKAKGHQKSKASRQPAGAGNVGPNGGSRVSGGNFGLRTIYPRAQINRYSESLATLSSKSAHAEDTPKGRVSLQAPSIGTQKLKHDSSAAETRTSPSKHIKNPSRGTFKQPAHFKVEGNPAISSKKSEVFAEIPNVPVEPEVAMPVAWLPSLPVDGYVVSAVTVDAQLEHTRDSTRPTSPGPSAEAQITAGEPCLAVRSPDAESLPEVQQSSDQTEKKINTQIMSGSEATAPDVHPVTIEPTAVVDNGLSWADLTAPTVFARGQRRHSLRSATSTATGSNVGVGDLRRVRSARSASTQSRLSNNPRFKHLRFGSLGTAAEEDTSIPVQPDQTSYSVQSGAITSTDQIPAAATHPHLDARAHVFVQQSGNGNGTQYVPMPGSYPYMTQTDAIYDAGAAVSGMYCDPSHAGSSRPTTTSTQPISSDPEIESGAVSSYPMDGDNAALSSISVLSNNNSLDVSEMPTEVAPQSQSFNCTYCTGHSLPSPETPMIFCSYCGVQNNVRYCSTACLVGDTFGHSYECQEYASYDRILHHVLPPELFVLDTNPISSLLNKTRETPEKFRQKSFAMLGRVGAFPPVMQAWAKKFNHHFGVDPEVYKRLGQYYVFRAAPYLNCSNAEVICTLKLRRGDPLSMALTRTLNACFTLPDPDLVRFLFRLLCNLIVDVDNFEAMGVYAPQNVILQEFKQQFNKEFGFLGFNVEEETRYAYTFDAVREWPVIEWKLFLHEDRHPLLRLWNNRSLG